MATLKTNLSDMNLMQGNKKIKSECVHKVIHFQRCKLYTVTKKLFWAETMVSSWWQATPKGKKGSWKTNPHFPYTHSRDDSKECQRKSSLEV